MDKNYILIIGWVAVMAMLSVLTSVKQEETVWEKRISVETGVGGCDSIAACMDVQSTWRHYGYRSISGGI